jgi:hypothetical protein
MLLRLRPSRHELMLWALLRWLGLRLLLLLLLLLQELRFSRRFNKLQLLGLAVVVAAVVVVAMRPPLPVNRAYHRLLAWT